MAYKEGNTLLKLAIVAVVVLVVWKKGIPWFQANVQSTTPAASSGTSGNPSCVDAVERASSHWGSGLGRFVNPPYDVIAWEDFRSEVANRIDGARSACSCDDDSCAKAGEAVAELDSLVSEVDGMIRNNSAPPGDIVRKQERIDKAIDDARELVRQGR